MQSMAVIPSHLVLKARRRAFPRGAPGWLFAAIILIASIIVLGSYIRFIRSPIIDFGEYYYSAAKLRAGGSLYHYALQFTNGGQIDAGVPPFLYPPAFILIILPLTFLPIDVAAAFWLTTLFACLIASVWLLVRLLFAADLLHRLAATLAISAALTLFQPVRASLFGRNADIILLFMVVLSLSAFSAGHDRRAVLWVVLAAAVKPFLGLLILLFLWKRAYRSIGVACLVGLATLVLPVLLLGPKVLTDFLDVTRVFFGSSSEQTWFVDPANQSPYGFLLRLFTVNHFTVPLFNAPTLVTVLRYALIGLIVLALAVTVRRSRAIPVQQLALEYGLILIAALLISPVTEDIYLTYLVIPGLAVVAMLQKAPSRPLVLVLLGGALVTTFAYLCLPQLKGISRAYYGYTLAPVGLPKVLLTGAHLYGLAALAAITVITLQRYGQRSRSR